MLFTRQTAHTSPPLKGSCLRESLSDRSCQITFLRPVTKHNRASIASHVTIAPAEFFLCPLVVGCRGETMNSKLIILSSVVVYCKYQTNDEIDCKGINEPMLTVRVSHLLDQQGNHHANSYAYPRPGAGPTADWAASSPQRTLSAAAMLAVCGGSSGGKTVEVENKNNHTIKTIIRPHRTNLSSLSPWYISVRRF